jgi:hypothetical protein
MTAYGAHNRELRRGEPIAGAYLPDLEHKRPPDAARYGEAMRGLRVLPWGGKRRRFWLVLPNLKSIPKFLKKWW